MKANKKLLASAMALGLAGLTTVGSTYAWFSMNKAVSATGMQVKATTASSLIIGTSEQDLANRKVTVGISGKDEAIAPSTLDWGKYTTTGLGYVTNPTDVDPNTGLAKPGANLNIQDITNDKSGVVYYLDYTMYIAASGSAMTAELSVKLGDLATVSGDLDKAFTVAFYVGDITSTNYKGSLRFNQTAESDKVVLVANAANSIPEANDGNIKVTARVFLDGAYEEHTGTANVNNGTVDTDTVTFGLNFTATE